MWLKLSNHHCVKYAKIFDSSTVALFCNKCKALQAKDFKEERTYEELQESNWFSIEVLQTCNSAVVGLAI